MYCTKKITDDLIWVGANDRRLAMFEGVYSVPYGVSYNSYLLMDEKIVLFDTVDKAVKQKFIENLDESLKGKEPDYLVVQHMEPDHSVAMHDVLSRYPGMQVVCNAKTLTMIKQFFDLDVEGRAIVVEEGGELVTGRHTLRFYMAPMVHWPEVMVTYDAADKILFSADAFGCFGALNGAIFADEVNFEKDYMDEARRYYANIVGKYGSQAGALLNKASALQVEMICPLHGFVWRRNLGDFMAKVTLWSDYEPEEYGVMIAYASVYGNTENAAEILASKLRDKGIKTQMFDVSVTPASEIVSAAFRWSHLVFASTTYNAGIFVTMEALIFDLAAHNIQNRKVAIIENGSWAPTSGGLIREQLERCKNISFIDNIVSIKSSLKTEQLGELDKVATAIAESLPASAVSAPGGSTYTYSKGVDMPAMFKLSYGLFVLTARDGDKDNGCIVNTVTQVTESPLRITVAVNKANYTCGLIQETGEFNVSVLAESAPFSIFQRFGFQSGRDADKFAGCEYATRAENGVRYVPFGTNGMISGKVFTSYDYGTHMLFVADVVQAFAISGEASVTYQYYFDHIKPKPPVRKEGKKGFVCKICGFVYDGDELPKDFICPLCKHGADAFEPS